MTDDPKPYYKKYHVIRTDNGDYVHERTFTLVPSRDECAVPALLAYADAVEGKNPELAEDLREWCLEFGEPSLGEDEEAVE